MRLTSEEIQCIKSSINEFDPQAKVYLFGSRVDDSKKGGDIDLLIFSEALDNKKKRLLRLRLFDKLGEQKIDIVIAKEASPAFVRSVLAQGILL